MLLMIFSTSFASFSSTDAPPPPPPLLLLRYIGVDSGAFRSCMAVLNYPILESRGSLRTMMCVNGRKKAVMATSWFHPDWFQNRWKLFSYAFHFNDQRRDCFCLVQLLYSTRTLPLAHLLISFVRCSNAVDTKPQRFVKGIIHPPSISNIHPNIFTAARRLNASRISLRT
eukprot:1012015_1